MVTFNDNKARWFQCGSFNKIFFTDSFSMSISLSLSFQLLSISLSDGLFTPSYNTSLISCEQKFISLFNLTHLQVTLFVFHPPPVYIYKHMYIYYIYM